MPIQKFASSKQGVLTGQMRGKTDVNYKPICATLEMIRTELVARSRPAAVKLFEYDNPGQS